MSGSCSRIHSLMSCNVRRSLFCSLPLSAGRLTFSVYDHLATQPPILHSPNTCSSFRPRCWVGSTFASKPTFISSSSLTHCYLSTSSSEDTVRKQENHFQYEEEEEEGIEPIDSWEKEDEAEPQIGDGGDGGGVVLQNCSWGARTLSIAHEVLQQFGDDMKLYAFKTSPRGYIYVRLDKLPNEYGCPSIEEIENYSRLFKKRLEEVGATGEIPEDLALEVSSPGAERLLKVPDDLHRFKDMPMRVSYMEDVQGKHEEKNGVFFLDSVEMESASCVWRLADVKENRDPSAKGRPLSRKKKDWRLQLPHTMFKRKC